MNTAFLAVLLAILGYSILNVTQAIQKMGLAMRKENKKKGSIVWLAATVGASLSVILVYIALSFGTVAVVGAMAGTGLVALALFSRFVMGERLRAQDVVAILAIVGAAAVVGYFAEKGRGTPNTALLYGILGAGAVIGALAWVLVPKGSATAITVGAFAGFTGSYSQLFQNAAVSDVTLSDGVWPFIVATVTEPLTGIWVGLSLASVVIMQFAYKHGDAIQIIPIFTSVFIITPVVGGLVVFGETLAPLQWVGVAVILIGAFVLGRREGAVPA
jgi:drug/metabolite transporter (DMT)-like permease